MTVFAEYKKARFNYEVLEQYEAGIELFGHEVKSVKKGSVTFEGSYIGVRGGEVFLMGVQISPYQPSNKAGIKDYDPIRARKVLIKKSEILELENMEAKKGLTIVPLSFYSQGPKIKLKFAVVRGKKQQDKRETMKKRDSKREIERTLKNQ